MLWIDARANNNPLYINKGTNVAAVAVTVFRKIRQPGQRIPSLIIQDTVYVDIRQITDYWHEMSDFLGGAIQLTNSQLSDGDYGYARKSRTESIPDMGEKWIWKWGYLTQTINLNNDIANSLPHDRIIPGLPEFQVSKDSDALPFRKRCSKLLPPVSERIQSRTLPGNPYSSLTIPIPDTI